MIKFENTISRHFDMSSLDDTQVERLKLRYQEISFKSIGLIQGPVDGSTPSRLYSTASDENYRRWYPTKRRTAIAQWYDPQTDNEIVFYPQGTVRSYITKRSGKTNRYFDKSYIIGEKPTLSEMMKAVLGQIVTSRTIDSRRMKLNDREFLIDVCGGEEIFESMLLTDKEQEILKSHRWPVNPERDELLEEIKNRRIS